MKAFITLIKTFYNYLLVGVLNTLLCFFIMYLGATAGLGYLAYTAMGYSISILFSFFMNLRYTFDAKGHTLKRLSVFLLINFTNLMLVEMIEHVLIESIGLDHLLAIFSAMIWYILSGFLLNNYIVYRRPIETIA